jgi:hypothetical protein
MKKLQCVIITSTVFFAMLLGSCKKYLDINTDPDRIPASNPPVEQLLTNAQINQANDAGGDFWRYSGLIVQYISGQASQPNQTYEYGRYNITGSDQDNLWLNVYSNTLSDLELVIKNASTNGSPNYSGVAKIMKAYEYQLIVDSWGDVPYSETQQLALNRSPKYDKGEDIYKNIINLLNEGITEVNAATSNLVPGTNSLIYGSDFTTARVNWVKLANTLKLRVFLHYSKKDPAFMVSQMNSLIASGAQFFASNADNYQFAFRNEPNARNPIDQFERSRSNYLFADDNIVSIMNSKNDPRRTTYFTPFSYSSNPPVYKGVKPGDLATVNYSRMHTYLRGGVVGSPPASAFNAQGGILSSTAITYTGDASIRMITYPEYCFIRAEAALRGVGAVADAQIWFTNGITASMQQAGVSQPNITTYLAANGTLAGTNAAQLRQVIEEKYIANYGVPIESWTDYRRTGLPVLTPPSNAVEAAVPRSLFYPQSEKDLNPNLPAQKPNQQVRIFWDTP